VKIEGYKIGNEICVFYYGLCVDEDTMMVMNPASVGVDFLG
jgi:hypothetical protein